MQTTGSAGRRAGGKRLTRGIVDLGQENPRLDSAGVSLMRSSRTARILVLDDVPEVRNAIVAILTYCFEGFVVTECSNGNEVWEKILMDPPDLLISDYTHPGLALEEIVRRVSVLRRKFPIIVLSAVIDKFPEVERRFVAMPQVAVVHKPFAIDDVRFQVSRFLR
jgi:CheY-like chemotaxis protein